MDLVPILKNINIKEILLTESSRYNLGCVPFSEWLDLGFGEAISECLMQSKVESIDIKSLIEKCLIIMEAIIPPMPPIFEESELGRLSYNAKRHSKISLVSCHDINLIDELISKVLKALLYLCSKFDVSLPLLGNVLYKAVYYAKETTLINHGKCFKRVLNNSPHIAFCIGCNDTCNIVAGLVKVLDSKMEKDWLKNLFYPYNVLNLDFIEISGDCPYVYAVHKFITHSVFDRWHPEVERCIFNSLVEKSLRILAQHIESGEMSEGHFARSGVSENLDSILSETSSSGHTPDVIKTFLSVFLKFKRDTQDNYFFDSCLYERLVKLVSKTVYYLSTNMSKAENYRTSHNKKSQPTIEMFKKSFDRTVDLLQSLQVLNSSWHQWFGIVEERKLVENSLFHFCLHEHSYGCIFCSVKLRLMYLTPPLSGSDVFETKGPMRCAITRTNVLTSIRSLCTNYLDYSWYFNFEGEDREGEGVNKEVYSILSQELQLHFLDIWQGDPVKIVGTKMKYTYSPNGLMPKVNGNIQHLEMLGKIFAKVVKNGYLLDIPVRDELFQLLAVRKSSHLSINYFEIVHSFPMFKYLFKQLLTIKVKIDSIQSEVGLSESQKKEIINNLTSDDGDSFDDLCLNFTVPGTDVELIEGGSNILLSPRNLDLYLEKLCLHLDTRRSPEIEAIGRGFDALIRQYYEPDELKKLICCEEFKKWTSNDLMEYCIYEYSQSIQFLFECLASFDIKEQRLFLLFTTGLSGLPSGGLPKLWPPLTISVLKCDNADSCLPTATNDVNKLHLPNYSSLEITVKRISFAINEEYGSFLLR